MTLAALLEEMAGVSIPHFFAGFFLILILYSGALLFTYWISKDE
jgi:hypothetical protein